MFMWITFISKIFQKFRLEPKNETKIWKPIKFLDLSNETFLNENYAIVILNRPINIDANHISILWNSAKYRCLVDGGANHWFDFFDKNRNLFSLKLPELLTGDFDSITDKAMNRLKDMNDVTVTYTPNEDFTDFTKCLMELVPHISKRNIRSVVVLLETSGRIDHIFAHVNTLVCSQIFLQTADVYILSKDSIAWLLTAGHHTIHIPKDFVKQNLWCSFVPIDGKCKVFTTGFKWNLENQYVQFGGICSTSNTYASDVVTIESDGLLYWSMGINEQES